MDYDYLKTCEFATDFISPDEVGKCGKPAVARVWWDDGSEMVVCEEHLQIIEEQEATDG